jgi:hypothetical protein
MFRKFNLFKFSAIKPSLIFLPEHLSPIKVDTYAVIGQTFSIKEKIKSLGFFWSGNLQVSVDGEDISGGWIQGANKISSIDLIKKSLSDIPVEVNLVNTHKIESIALSNEGITGFFDSSSNHTVISGETKPIKDILSKMGYNLSWS